MPCAVGGGTTRWGGGWTGARRRRHRRLPMGDTATAATATVAGTIGEWLPRKGKDGGEKQSERDQAGGPTSSGHVSAANAAGSTLPHHRGPDLACAG